MKKHGRSFGYGELHHESVLKKRFSKFSTAMNLLVVLWSLILIGRCHGFNSPLKHGRTNDIPPDMGSFRDLNLGFHGVIDEDHWQRETIEEDDPPTLYATSLDVTLIGKTMISFEGRALNCFQGLRYAEPPLRFKPPLELKPPYYGEDEYVANHLPVKCAQHGVFASNIPTGSEDCLYLSVYTPYLPNSETGEYDKLLPVMVFLHGGAFIWGDSSLYLPTRLLDEDVLLVVPHYRLGSFGFFSTMDKRAPGNIAFYDQRMALKWVQKHITSFGGDPTKVTIFGQSAGSASVNYHLIIPASGGLFRGVIGESGSALEHWSLDEDPLDSAMAIGEINGCNTTNIDTVYECMMALDQDVITLGINDLSKKDRFNGMMGFRGAAPIIQNPDMDLSEFESEPLITMHPQEYYRKGIFNKDASLMIGANKQEGSFIFGIMYTSYMLPRNLTTNATYIREGMVSDMLKSFGVDDPTHSIAESLIENYFTGANRSDLDSSTPGMIDMSGVLFQKAGALETAKLHSHYKDSTDVNTYLYAFEFESDDTSFDWLFMGHVEEIPFDPGVTHSDDLLYLFSWPAVMEGHQVVIKNRMVKLWTNFATYLNPTPPEDDSWKDLDIPFWPNFDVSNESYLLMEDVFTIQKEYSHRWKITNDELLPEVEDEYKQQRDAFLATTIVFIVLFVAACCACAFFFWKLYY